VGVSTAEPMVCSVCGVGASGEGADPRSVHVERRGRRPKIKMWVHVESKSTKSGVGPVPEGWRCV
jgi:hypothetical protein